MVGYAANLLVIASTLLSQFMVKVEISVCIIDLGAIATSVEQPSPQKRSRMEEEKEPQVLTTTIS